MQLSQVFRYCIGLNADYHLFFSFVKLNHIFSCTFEVKEGGFFLFICKKSFSGRWEYSFVLGE